MQPISSGVFDQPRVLLRAWFDDRTGGLRELLPENVPSEGLYAFPALAAARAEDPSETVGEAAEEAGKGMADKVTGLLGRLSAPFRVVAIVLVAALAHMLVVGLRRGSEKLMTARLRPSMETIKSVAGLVTSTLTFLLYFGAVGLVLNELGVPFMAYLASASVIGLAIGFGSQGIVQDVVTGLTLIFSNLVSLGDMVEIAGQTGVVRMIGMRFTVLENALGGQVCIPNRTIGNVVNYTRGHVRCALDIVLPRDSKMSKDAIQRVEAIVASAQEQFPGIILSPPAEPERKHLRNGKEVLRVTLQIWPGRGTPLETTVKQEIVQALREVDSTYADWMVAVNYEVQERETDIAFRSGR